MLARCPSNTISNGQDRFAGIEPMHGLGDDAAGLAGVVEVRGGWLVFDPALDDLVQGKSGQLRRVELQEPIEA